MNPPDRTRAARPGSTRPVSTLRRFAEIAGAALAGVLSFAAVDFLFAKAVAARFPAPAQAAVWSTIAMFVAATVGLAVAAQVWWLLSRRR